MRKIVLISMCVFVFAMLAKTASAQIVFSEIMYDPQGSDAAHEWVEILNQGGSPLDLSQCKAKSPCRFIEASNNHELSVVSGEGVLQSGAYAVIADSPQTFLKDYPGFSGTLVDSSFSLKNTGETIAFKMPDGSISDTVTYTSDMGATGDGNSLQKLNGIWNAATPTPGGPSTYAQKSTTDTTSTQTGTSQIPSTVPSRAISSFPVEPQIFADAGMQTKTVSVGAPVIFSGRVWGLKKEPIDNARIVWAFGDGGMAEGASVAHIYYYPGEYTAVLDAASGYYSASDRVRVMAVAPLLALHAGGDNQRSFIAIENYGGEELDLSGWQIAATEKIFTLPKNTLIGGHKTLTVASEVSGLLVATSTVAQLRFPNGVLVPLSNTSVLPVDTTNQKIVSQIAPRVQDSKQITIYPKTQTASTLDVFDDASTGNTTDSQESSLWAWYVGITMFGVVAALGLRMSRKNDRFSELSPDDFKIIEEKEDSL